MQPGHRRPVLALTKTKRVVYDSDLMERWLSVYLLKEQLRKAAAAETRLDFVLHVKGMVLCVSVGRFQIAPKRWATNDFVQKKRYDSESIFRDKGPQAFQDTRTLFGYWQHNPDLGDILAFDCRITLSGVEIAVPYLCIDLGFFSVEFRFGSRFGSRLIAVSIRVSVTATDSRVTVSKHGGGIELDEHIERVMVLGE